MAICPDQFLTCSGWRFDGSAMWVCTSVTASCSGSWAPRRRRTPEVVLFQVPPKELQEENKHLPQLWMLGEKVTLSDSFLLRARRINKHRCPSVSPWPWYDKWLFLPQRRPCSSFSKPLKSTLSFHTQKSNLWCTHTFLHWCLWRCRELGCTKSQYLCRGSQCIHLCTCCLWCPALCRPTVRSPAAAAWTLDPETDGPSWPPPTLFFFYYYAAHSFLARVKAWGWKWLFVCTANRQPWIKWWTLPAPARQRRPIASRLICPAGLHTY